MEILKTVGKVIVERMSGGLFSLDKILAASGCERIPARRSLERLCREGLITKIEKKQEPACAGDGPRKKGRPVCRISYRVKDLAGLAARIAPKQREDTALSRMWKVIRFKKIFTRKDLVVLAGATFENAKWFTKGLRDLGLIEKCGKGGPGMAWRLTEDVGARRPHIPKGLKEQKGEQQGVTANFTK